MGLIRAITLIVLSLTVLQQTDGATYIRWGQTDCPCWAQKVYQGFTAGSHYTHKGGASNYMCLPDKPTWTNYTAAAGATSYVYGTEYEIPAAFPIGGATNKLQNQDVPCVMCLVPRFTVSMFPGKAECFPGWTLEYTGYIVAAHHTHHRSEFVCLDAQPQVLSGGNANVNGALFYLVETVCGSLPCPPYVSYRELSCAVCTIT